MRKGIGKKHVRFAAAVSALLLVLCLSLPVSATPEAPDYAGGSDWGVTFNAAGNRLEDTNFTAASFADVFNRMQPGDDAKVTLKLTNAYKSAVNWYMDNDVLRSLENDSVAQGGIYTYKLTYTAPGGQQMVLFSSDTVGGDYVNTPQQVGLNEINNSFMNNYDANNVNRQGEAYFYLGEIASGQSGQVTLYILLDGETQGNDYQDTLAQLAMKFAVEIVTTNATPTTVPTVPGGRTSTAGTTIVKTGDTSNSLLFIVIAAAAGAVLLVLAILSMKLRKKDAEDAEDDSAAQDTEEEP